MILQSNWLKCNSNLCHRYNRRLLHHANISSAATDATPLALAIKSNGEQIAGTEMDFTASGANVYGNVSASTLIVVPYGASKTISVGNVLTANTLVKNANIIIEKVS